MTAEGHRGVVRRELPVPGVVVEARLIRARWLGWVAG